MCHSWLGYGRLPFLCCTAAISSARLVHECPASCKNQIPVVARHGILAAEVYLLINYKLLTHLSPWASSRVALIGIWVEAQKAVTCYLTSHPRKQGTRLPTQAQIQLG